ncbi:MAG: hypothetical protein R3Y04_03835 [Rikenellaceae bacterium]
MTYYFTSTPNTYDFTSNNRSQTETTIFIVFQITECRSEKASGVDIWML